MPQDFSKQTNKTPALTEGMVLPQDNVTVYGTATTQFYAEGQAFEVHSAIAKKLVKAGKATEKAPEVKKADK